MSLSEGEHYTTTAHNSPSHSNKETESAMLQTATSYTSDNNEVISRRDDDTFKVLNVEPVRSVPAADVVRDDLSPSKSTPPVTDSNTDEIVSSKPPGIEIATILNDESAPITSSSIDGGNNEIVLTFPQRLMEMLDDPQNAEMMAWLPHGRAFAIYRKREFASDVLPKYFQKAAKYSSFTRKLNRWGFIRVTRGPETGAYYHPLFRRNERRLVLQMTCHTSIATNNDSANPNTSTGSSIVSTRSKRVSGSTHASVENDSMPMMMYPNYMDPAASQYMYHQNPFAIHGPQQHPSQYPQMGPHAQHYHGSTMPPYNMYEETPVDGIMPDERQYYQYPRGMGSVYPNHYPMPPQPNGQFMDSYSQASYHDNNKHFNNSDMLPYGDKSMTRQNFQDDTAGQPRRMSGMAERVETSSRNTPMVATAKGEEFNESKSNYRTVSKGMTSFRPPGRGDTGYDHSYYHHHYSGADEDDMMMYPPPPYDNMDVVGGPPRTERPAILPTEFEDESERMRHARQPRPEHGISGTPRNPTQNYNMDHHSMYSPAVGPSSSYNNNATHPSLL